MLLRLDDKHKANLKFLKTVEGPVVVEFCRIAISFIRDGAKPGLYSKAAQKLEADAEVVKNCVEGLTQLFIEAVRVSLSEIDFVDSLLLLQFDEETREALREMYIENRKSIRETVNALNFELPSYDGVEWRLDIQMGSRTCHSQMVPIYMIRLKLKNPERTIVLQTNYSNLKHVCESLEKALKEHRTGHFRRIARNIK
mmetsp:Transcript_7723/g.21914  ORF Transcript_7723/g.21914 Transcript_7723/m.21914 type:complete len:198 (-) Transcript_7723:497-1090(-)|eukprot:CAMPEP_0119120048 /NCGR_PEP_ID=MMETSP1310-20130426/1266_1 /TAXON_ID=464262 /ORGANISM="Genus nov. species nov., Strain RCC2339" /LENGTH=197 /DNA_ID=CAMNT_0007109511 /DNA_START=75 /DNA_END=668 /DNA_ORIENTATION=+